MVRPPQPAVYVFLIDVSHAAVQCGAQNVSLCVCIYWANDSAIGMVATATRTILENLDRIPDEDERTKVAIICYDTSLYFFSMPVGINSQKYHISFLICFGAARDVRVFNAGCV